MLLYLTVIAGIGVFYVEWRRCVKRKEITCMLVTALFNIVFLHAWILVFLSGEANEAWDESSVALKIFVQDIVWLLMLLSFKAKTKGREEVKANKKDVLVLVVFFVICVIFACIYLNAVGISMLSNDIEWARHNAKKGYGYLNMFITRGLLLSAIVALVLRKTKHTGAVSFIGMVIAVAALQLATGFRAYFINTALILWVANRNYGSKYSSLDNVKLVVYGGGLFSAISLYRAFAGGSGVTVAQSLETLLAIIDHRVLMEAPRIIAKLDDVTNMDGFLYGMTYWWDIYAILPGPGYSFGDRVFMWLANTNEIAGIAPIPAALVAESYSNFGYIGIAAVMPMVFLIIYSVDSFTPKNPEGFALKACLILLVAEIIYLGVGTVLLSRIMTLVFFYALYLGVKKCMASMKFT